MMTNLLIQEFINKEILLMKQKIKKLILRTKKKIINQIKWLKPQDQKDKKVDKT